jgi:hypothetical protein
MQHILLYGTSILLAGLAAQLVHLPGMQVYCRESLTRLGDLADFDAVLVDFNDLHAIDVITMLRARPDLKVIGINDAAGVLTRLEGQVYLVQNLEDIVQQLAQA